MDGKKVAIIGVASAALLTGGFFLYRFLRDTAAAAKFKDDSKKDDSKTDNKPTIIERIVNVATGGSGDRPTSKADIKAFQKWVIDVKKDKTILGSGGDSGFGDDGVWGRKTQKAWDTYGAEYKNKDKASGASAGSGQNPNWSSTDNYAQKELFDRLDDLNLDVDYDGSRWEWDVTNGYPTVYFQVYKDGLLVLEKQAKIYGGRYAKESGTWKKTATGWQFTFKGKTYNAPYSGSDLLNTLWGLMKDANYFKWSDSKFVYFLDGEPNVKSSDILDSAM
jgi:hypothetical protein